MSNTNYIFNKAPLVQTPTSELPLGAVKPRGWLYNQLKIQSEGLIGHLDEFWDSVGSYSGWLGGTGENWERGPYYLDGFLPLAYLLEDEKLVEKTRKWVEWSINHQTEDGNFGPQNNEDWWPRMVMLKVLIQYQEVTGDQRVIELMKRYFRFVQEHIEAKPLFSWGEARGGDLIFCIYWLYNRTRAESLLELAEIIHKQTKDWTDIFSEFPFVKPTKFYQNWEYLRRMIWEDMQAAAQHHATHIVNIAMGIKEPGLYYQQSGDKRHKDAVIKGIESLTRYHGQVNGLFSGDEHLSGRSPSQGSELCSVVEYMFSLETLLDIYEGTWVADTLEKLAYNALPATITKDWWGHQYVQQANQVLVTKAKRNWFNNNDEANLFGLEPNFGCCTANMHQGWPKFVKALWRATEDGGAAAVVYAPSEAKLKVAGGAEVTIEEETEYPFDETIRFRIRTGGKVKFPLKLRIPGWCQGAAVRVNGEAAGCHEAGTYVVLDREWSAGDTVELALPMKVRASYWYNNSVGIERGPIVYALKIGEEWRKLKGADPYADWEVYPTTPWNYALVLDTEHPDNSFEVVRKDVANQPFDAANPPVILKAKGRRLPEWALKDNSAGEVPVSPVVSGEPEEEIELIPYGAAKLRISQFPYMSKIVTQK